MIESFEAIIWGRSFVLPVEYDCYDGESVTEEQIKAMEIFSSHSDWISEAKSVVESFCKEQVMDDDANMKKDNIFSYVKPECIFVKHDAKDPRIAMMCKYRYDPEHGLAVVFSLGGNITVGIQDIIL